MSKIKVVVAGMMLSVCALAAPMRNLSSRGFVDTGENLLIGGLSVEDGGNFLIRGAGPTLSLLGVAHPVAKPQLTLFDTLHKPILSNANWRQGIPPNAPSNPTVFPAQGTTPRLLQSVCSAVGAFPYGEGDDTLLYVHLDPGNYTAHLTAGDSRTGVGLIEIYAVSEAQDPFPAYCRTRVYPEDGYNPVQDGLAPCSPVPDTGVLTLVLQFNEDISWTSNGVAYGPTRFLKIPFFATGTKDVQRGQAGAFDSRGWRVSDMYTKTGEDTADVQVVGTPDTSAHWISENLHLTFTGLGEGSFTGSWGADSTTVQPNSVGGSFFWTRSSPPILLEEKARRPFYRVIPHAYKDGRDDALWALDVSDVGPVLRHGSGPVGCDVNGMREASLVLDNGTFYLYYDGCAVGGWRTCLATSRDLTQWTFKGAMLDYGAAGAIDSGAAASPWFHRDGDTWCMYYLATPLTNGAPDFIPYFPYHTRLATSASLEGPWTKHPDVIPFDLKAGSYYDTGASPGYVIEYGGEYLQYFSAGPYSPEGKAMRTLGLARTKNLQGTWTPDAAALLPETEQVENSSVIHDDTTGLWYLFTNHVGVLGTGGEYTDAIWVYWSEDPTHFDPARKAVVLDGSRCKWAKGAIGMPSVARVGGQLVVLLYDAAEGQDFGHMRRDIGQAWLNLSVAPPF